VEENHKREWAGSCGFDEIGFGIRTGGRKDKMTGDTGGNVDQRFYGYCLRGVARNEVASTKNGENDSAKYRVNASVKCSSDFMKVIGTYERNSYER
jgi:hypothetical protein